MRLWFIAVSVLVFSVTALHADDTKEKPKAPELPIKATLKAKKTTYTLDLGGKSGEEFRKLLKDNAKTGKLPVAPKVDLVLELKNTSDKAVTLWTSGDPVVLTLDLKGEGAVTTMGRMAFTREFRVPKAMALEAGKTYEIPVTSLNFGFRGVAQRAYWTAPGEYQLSANFQTGIAPAPPGTKANRDGFGSCVIKSEPVKITVKATK